MSDTATNTRQQALMDVLFHALRVTDASLNKNAALVLSQLGGDPVSRLILEAARRKNRVPHRIRVLAVIQRIGQLSSADDWLLLSTLAADPNEQILRRGEAVLGDLSGLRRVNVVVNGIEMTVEKDRARSQPQINERTG